ncbi:hypothetical protein BE21_19815 [Sorangium cellulosum]|uniref:site-specific DNA-methyltransferase (adenine-specific) n=1 Tax=Sorangium cellulosum TaxID=56 RepID=A0A150TWG8_SORCE|nr:hypothetical protein BE21_19815 [Sorangium cellulosum]
MALVLQDCTFQGHAITEPFARGDLEGYLLRAKLLPRASGLEGNAFADQWDVYRRKLRALGQGGPARVAGHVLEPLVSRLGYASLRRDGEVHTREGDEDAGWLFETADGSTRLRSWAIEMGADLDAPTERGKAYRYSPSQIAQRVLQTKDERIALLTDGSELRIILRDPGRRESYIAIHLDQTNGWRGSRQVPDSYRLLVALAQPAGILKIAELVEQARLAQTRVTATLRDQAKQAVQSFVQALLDDPQNAVFFARHTDKQALAQKLYSDALILVYRLLFILKLESSPDPAQGFSFASTSLWRNTYSPTRRLAYIVKKALDDGAETGEMLSGGVRALFRMFQEGFRWSEMRVNKLGGMLFGTGAAPLLDDPTLRWSELATAKLLDNFLRTPRGQGGERQFVHYGQLEVEDLGHIYEALLELEPGIAAEPMCRLRRQKLEVVVPLAQGERYRGNVGGAEDAVDEDTSDDEDERPAKVKTRVQWAGEIREGAFYLRVGLGRKATGSYYTPHAFVRFLVQETLGPQVAERSPTNDPVPLAILGLKVLDPAMGSGHFLVEACRFLGDALYEACRTCDAKAKEAEDKAERVKGAEQVALLAEATKWRQRVVDLPDPNDEMLGYLPSRAKEGEESGISTAKAKALAKRLVAVHCLYGVDKNPLAVELARLALWLESYAEGLPLTFLDHRLVVGDSLTGPLFEKLGTYPQSGNEFRDLFSQKLRERLTETLAEALQYVKMLESTIGKDVADIELKREAKRKLDQALSPLRLLAGAWSGGVMLGEEADDDAYRSLMEVVASKGDPGELVQRLPVLGRMVAAGREAVPYDLMFPEVFYPQGRCGQHAGFDAVIGNPPWEKLRIEEREIAATIDPTFLEGRESAGVGNEAEIIRAVVTADASAAAHFTSITRSRRAAIETIRHSLAQVLPWRTLDTYQLFASRCVDWACHGAGIGLVLGGGFAKSPTEEQFRHILSEFAPTEVLAHYLNVKQLFGGISSRVSFTLWVARVGDVMLPPLAGHSLREFDDIGTPGARGGKLVPLTPSGAPHTESAASALAALEAMGVFVTEGLHRKHNKDYFSFVDESIPDAREPNAIKLLAQRGLLCLYGGKSVDAFDAWPRKKAGKWDPCVTLLAAISCPRVAGTIDVYGHYRLAWRNTCGLTATNERSSRACILPPAVAALGSLMVETRPHVRANSTALSICSVLNTFAYDEQVRAVVQTNFNKSILNKTVWPVLHAPAKIFLAHAALRLSSIHEGYAPLWREQFGNVWREPTPKHTWPVLAGDDARWAMRAAIDAVVADAYGLSREQYARVLAGFSHKSYPKASERCLTAFDELKRAGLDAFVKAHDPYWDVPLVESLPEPVINLGAPADTELARAQAECAPKPAALPDRKGQLSLIVENGQRVNIRPVQAVSLPAAPALPAAQTPPKAPAKPHPWLQHTPIDRQVFLLSRIVDAHNKAGQLRSLGNVKAEKLVHLVEAHLGIDLERAATRQAAGPADFRRLQQAIHRGTKIHAFTVITSAGGTGGVWSPNRGLRKVLQSSDRAFGDLCAPIDHLIGLFVRRTSDQAEIAVTLYASWNDLLADGADATEDAIIRAFYDWSAAKAKFPRNRLEAGLRWMREHDLVPSGRARRTAVSPTAARAMKGERQTHRSPATIDRSAASVIEHLLAGRGVITSRDAQAATGLDANGVRLLLKQLAEEGKAVVEGEKRGTRYRWVGGSR